MWRKGVHFPRPGGYTLNQSAGRADTFARGPRGAGIDDVESTERMSREYTNYQKKVISRYYENREQIDAQKLAELVTNLYLATGKKREKLWESAEEAMRRLKVPESRIAHVVKTQDPAILAEVVNDLQAGRI